MSERKPVIEIGSDHRGHALKRRMIAWLEAHGHSVHDHGCDSAAACDYPDYAYPTARAVAVRPGARGVLICSNGIGMAMVANKVPGVRAALCVTPAMALQSRRHNNANLLALGADNVSADENLAILEAWLGADFAGGRHVARVAKLMAGEQGRAAGGAAPRAPVPRAAERGAKKEAGE